jgi:hypothetical protein
MQCYPKFINKTIYGHGITLGSAVIKDWSTLSAILQIRPTVQLQSKKRDYLAWNGICHLKTSGFIEVLRKVKSGERK